jgi:hypothetical protein
VADNFDPSNQLEKRQVRSCLAKLNGLDQPGILSLGVIDLLTYRMSLHSSSGEWVQKTQEFHWSSVPGQPRFLSFSRQDYRHAIMNRFEEFVWRSGDDGAGRDRLSATPPLIPNASEVK